MGIWPLLNLKDWILHKSKVLPTIKEILMLFLVGVSHKWVQIQHRPTLFTEIISMIKANQVLK